MNSISNGLNGNNELQNLMTEAMNYVQEQVRNGSPAHTVEKGLFERVLKLGHQLLGVFFKSQGDGSVGDILVLADGNSAKKLGTRARNYRSLFGDIPLVRTVYGKRHGQAITCIPLDTRLQLPEEEYSYALQEIIQHLTTEVPYTTARDLVNRLLKTGVTVDSMERINQHAGDMVHGFRETQSVPPAATEAEILVSTADGKGVPIRHTRDRARICEQRLGSGPKPERKRMAVVGAVYTISPFIRTPAQILEALFCEPDQVIRQDRPKRPSPRNKRVVAHLTRQVDGTELNATQSTFEWISRQIRERGQPTIAGQNMQAVLSNIAPASQGKIHLAMMDGQESLWKQVSQLKATYPERQWVEILDLMHVNSYLWDAACAFHPGDTKQQLVFMKEYVLDILEGKVEEVIIRLQHMASRKRLNKSLQKTVVTVCRYFTNNRHRMKYNDYLAAGYPIATGVIEGACRHFVKDRMERAGMRWSIGGAQAMLNLRSANLNGELDAFCQYRIQKQNQKLYPHSALVATIEWPIAA